jgi:NADH:ubiquinone reductase (H+-translocating)
MTPERVPHVVVVGGGFGGLYAARALKGAPVRVTVIDRRNHHLFQPLLYQVANAVLSPADIAAPIRHILRRQRNTSVLLAEVEDIDPTARTVGLADGRRIEYDFLILATGARHHYFGHPEWEKVAPGLKTIEDATELRRRYLSAFESAEQETDTSIQRELLTFVVIGAGPTGAEMAGSMAEAARHTLINDFRRIDPSSARVILLEGGHRVLPAYSEQLSDEALRMLDELGVEVRTDAIVSRIESDAVWIGDERIPTRNVVWAAGVTASPLGAKLGTETDRVGRVVVRPDLSVTGHPELFVIGDLAVAKDRSGAVLPGIAPVAMQQGRAAARNIVRIARGEPTEAFRYADKGSMATLGRFRAVAHVFGRDVAGFVAWFLWVFIHILYLSGFRNRLVVLVQWAWSFISWQRGARLITGPVKPVVTSPHEPTRGGAPAHPGAFDAGSTKQTEAPGAEADSHLEESRDQQVSS